VRVCHTGDGLQGGVGRPTSLGVMENQPLHGGAEELLGRALGAEELLGRALVVVVDDRVSRGESSDTIGAG